MKKDIESIRKAVLMSRGVPATATNSQIRAIWNGFDGTMKKEYMDKAFGGKKNVSDHNSGKGGSGSDRT